MPPKTFEEGLQRLQELLAKMQDETTTLDQSVKLYAEAAQLIQYCNTALRTLHSLPSSCMTIFLSLPRQKHLFAVSIQ